MKKAFTLLISLLFITTCFSQDHFYTKKGVAIEGYDVTEYFNNKAIKGSSKYSAVYMNATFHFASVSNLEKFKANPDLFLPEYGGYCAYAIGKKGKKVTVDPETFSLENGKVYLFYNSWGNNTLNSWNEEGTTQLKEKANKNWKKIE